ncbi:C40 family peptidase [Corynebacterium kroppenstedtii]|uniref:C40 family peptidase n=1 Tax=Corynebacterium sp. PCR 32 TaxID=3351342 RepID=UPI0030A0E955
MRLNMVMSRYARAAVAATSLPALLAFPVVSPTAAHADPAPAAPLPANRDDLFAKMSTISRDAEHTAEMIKDLEDKIKGADQTLKQAQRDVDSKSDAARTASERADAIRMKVDQIALSRYRKIGVNPATAYIGASNPQDAIDRASYMNALVTGRQHTLDQYRRELTSADKERETATKAKDAAQNASDTLSKQEKELLAKQAELKTQTDQIKTAIDHLSGDERRRWQDKNSPIHLGKDQIKSANAVVNAALSKLGAPYAWGAIGPDEFDCSGLIYWAYRQAGKSVPRTSGAQMAGGTPVSMSDLQPGDVIGYYPGATHVGLYIGDGRIVHAADYGIPVQVVGVNSMPVYGARRY